MAKARERLILLLLVLVLSMNLIWIATWWPREEESGPKGAVTLAEVRDRSHHQQQLHLGLQEQRSEATPAESNPTTESAHPLAQSPQTTCPPPPHPVQSQGVFTPDLNTMVEQMRWEQRVAKSVDEIWWKVRAELKAMGQQCSADKLSGIIQSHYTSLLANIQGVEKLRNGSQEGRWKAQLAQETASLLDRRIHHLQHPKDCHTARKLLCQLNKPCGFGCQIHHVTYCFIVAYATERTMVLESKRWQYASSGWESVFLPISSSCTEASGATPWGPNKANVQTLSLPPVENLNPRPPQMPMAFPRDLADRLMSFHGYPFVWFIGHVIRYLCRPNAELKEYIDSKRRALNFKHPIVGVHIRRTDKLQAEAKYHSAEEYMTKVEEWFAANFRDVKDVQKRVYLASDDPSVLEEAKKGFPDYVYLNDISISKLASKTSSRYSIDSLHGVIFDVQMLSECDYLVCTFSSQVCRLAYELMQTRHVDASRKFYSLDDIYYFGGQQEHSVIAIERHESEQHGEISFEVGDVLGIAGNERDGYSVGVNRKSGRRGKFPSYKAEERFIIEDFPTYPQVA